MHVLTTTVLQTTMYCCTAYLASLVIPEVQRCSFLGHDMQWLQRPSNIWICVTQTDTDL